jgi:predicted CXXCH cytochrome family protein
MFGQAPELTYADTFTTGLSDPGRLALAPGGGIYVTDEPAGQVIEYDAAGAVLNTYSIPEGPVGIAVHPSGQVFISRSDGEVGVYSSAFVYEESVDPTPFSLTAPNDIAIHPDTGEVYVVDSERHRIMVFDYVTDPAPAGWKLVLMWGYEGQALSAFDSPQAIAIDAASDRVVVADVDGFRIDVFDIVGTHLFKFGYRVAYAGMDPVAWIARTGGIAIDECGTIYASDALMGVVRAFDPDGVDYDISNPPIGYGTGDGELRVPRDLIIDDRFPTTRLYVVSTNNSAVEVFTVGCTAAAMQDPEPPGEFSSAQNAQLSRRAGQASVPSADAIKKRPVLPEYPDNPLAIVEAIHAGTYVRELDLNMDRSVDWRDLSMAVTRFGAGTVEGFLALGGGMRDYPPTLEAPHMHTHPEGEEQYPWICGRCHSLDQAPGGMLTVEGQENLCLSCHSPGGTAMHKVIGGIDDNINHPLGVPADDNGVQGPDPDSELALHLDDGDIRCGTCHDQHTSVMGEPYLRAETGRGQLCGECHVQTSQWLNAGHADEEGEAFVHYDWTQPNRAACRKCHSGNGFIDFSKGVPDAEQSGEFRVHDCLVCHATHGEDSDHLLRVIDEVELPGGVIITDAGHSASCMVCHNGRRTPGGSSAAPHYLLGGVMLVGINGAEFGATLTNSAHSSVAGCVDCHMGPTPADGDPGAGKVGGHSFNMEVHTPGDPDEGFQNVGACNAAVCHGDTGPLVDFNRPAYGDFDGNGTIDGVQDEVQGLRDALYAEILIAGAVDLGGYPYWDFSAVVDDPPGFLQTVRDAVWNWEYVKNDHSNGIHNTDYTVGLLQVSIEALTGSPVPDAELRYTPAGLGPTIVEITGVNGGAPVETAGTFTVEFTIEDDQGAPIAIGDLDRLRLYVSGPTENYQRVIYSDSDPLHFTQNGDGSYTYDLLDPFPGVYLAPLNDSPAYGTGDGEMTGDPLLEGTYTVLIESRRVFGSIRKAGDATYDFVVADDAGSPPAPAPRQFVLRDACNECHNDLQIHGGNRFAVTGCVVCHTRGAEDRITDPVSSDGVTIQFGDMIHKIHRGHDMASVAATANGADPYRYQVIGYGSSVHDFSEVGFPIIPNGVMECAKCHGAAAQAADIYANVTRANCGGCHEDIDFTTGTILDDTETAVQDGTLTVDDLDDLAYRAFPGHDELGLGGQDHTAASDSFCSGCHGVGMPWDVEQLHQHPTTGTQEGTNPAVEILSVAGMTGGGGTYFQAGDYFEVTFKLLDDTANPLEIIPGDSSTLDRLEVILAGPTVLYQTIITAQRPWSSGALNVDPLNWVDNFAVDGTYTFISVDPWPADYPAQLNSIGEPPADQIFSFEQGWGQQYTGGGTALDNGTYSVVVYGRRVTPVAGEREPFATDVFDAPFGAADPIVPYAGTVETASCNACHGRLAFHGNQRYGVESCTVCHTAGTQDGGTYETVGFRVMIHKLHNARNLDVVAQGGAYELNGYSGVADFSHLLISSMPGEAAECAECHTTDAWKSPPLRDNMRTWKVACTSCHDAPEVATHVDAMTLPGTFTELCTFCHGVDRAYSVENVHASP